MRIELPPLAKNDYERLKTSLKSDGQRIPILVNADSGEIIDGEHRLKACQELGIEPAIERYVLTEKEAARLRISLNLARRQLSPEQKIELDLQLAQVGFTQRERAELIGMSRSRLSEIENTSIVDSDITCIPDLRFTVSKEQEDEIAERVEAGQVQAQVAADYGISQQRASQILRKVKAKRRKSKAVAPPPFPKEKYRCIVIDPPWPVKKIEREVRPDQGVELDYPVMSLEEIESLPIGRLVDAAGCHIYLWVTHKFLPAGLDIFKSWGVKYECVLTWVKNVGFTPFSWMYSTEHVLFGRIGTLALQKKGLRVDFSAKVREHSRKPDIFYDLVRQASPEPRIDLFSRERREGFAQWGDEIEKFAKI